MSAKESEIWLNLGRCLMCLALETPADYNSGRDFLQCMGLNTPTIPITHRCTTNICDKLTEYGRLIIQPTSQTIKISHLETHQQHSHISRRHIFNSMREV